MQPGDTLCVDNLRPIHGFIFPHSATVAVYPIQAVSARRYSLRLLYFTPQSYRDSYPTPPFALYQFEVEVEGKVIPIGRWYHSRCDLSHAKRFCVDFILLLRQVVEWLEAKGWGEMTEEGRRVELEREPLEEQLRWWNDRRRSECPHCGATEYEVIEEKIDEGEHAVVGLRCRVCHRCFGCPIVRWVDEDGRDIEGAEEEVKKLKRQYEQLSDRRLSLMLRADAILREAGKEFSFWG